MALKPDRKILHTDGFNYCNTVSEAGGIASAVSPGGSGGYPGNSKNVVSYSASAASAKPIGLLLQDVVSYDTNRQHENWEKAGDVALIGQKVVLLREGMVNTNMIATGISPAFGDPAYLSASGTISNVLPSGTSYAKVGQWQSSKDSDGYARLVLNIQG